MRRLSKFPEKYTFEKQAHGSDIQQVTMRLVVGYGTMEPYLIGTAFVAASHLLVTARHVVEGMVQLEGANGVQINSSLSAIQVISGKHIAIWQVMKIFLCQFSDIAFLHVASQPSQTKGSPKRKWAQPYFNSTPPAVGERIAAMGYREGKIKASGNEDKPHYDLSDDLMVTTGTIREIFKEKRDRSMLRFPCYEVNARFDAGMSGGPVYSETGAVCGMICSGLGGETDDSNQVSYVATLWPMFLTKMMGGRGKKHPEDYVYEVFDLAKEGVIRVLDLEELILLHAFHHAVSNVKINPV